MKWIYLSPHLDDAALSCGGLIWTQVQEGTSLEVWTICAGDPPPGAYSLFAQVLAKTWELPPEAAVAARRAEDERSMAALGAVHRYFSVPDAIFRKDPKTGEALYTSDEDLFGGLHPGDGMLLERLAIDLAEHMHREVTLVLPLTIGNHVDHQLVRAAAELINAPRKYYADYPYVATRADVISALAPQGAKKTNYPVSAEGLAAWQASVAAHESQISTFWNSMEEMREAIAKHCETFGGVTLWG